MKTIVYYEINASTQAEQEKQFIEVFLEIEKLLATNALPEKMLCQLFNVTDDHLNEREIIKQIVTKKNIANSRKERKKIVLEDTKIVVKVLIDNDENLDVFSYRYLFLMKNTLLRSDDVICLCCSRLYYSKVASFMLFENQALFGQRAFARMYAYLDEYGNGQIQFLPTKGSYSREWFPLMSFQKNNSRGLYNVLSTPLWSSLVDYKQDYDNFTKCNNKSAKFDFGNIKQNSSNERDDEDNYRQILKRQFLFWTQKEEIDFATYATEIPAMASLLTGILLANDNKNRDQSIINSIDKKTTKIIDVCCDFAESILQVIENIISHSKGGCCLIRLNKNHKKIRDILKDNSINTYLRISLLDYSDKGICQNIESSLVDEQIKVENLSSIFQPKVESAFFQYLQKEDNVVHHYGLAVFKETVLQYGGYFKVKSNGKPNVDRCNTFCDAGEKFNKSGYAQREYIPGTEYDVVLPLYEKMFILDNDDIVSIPFRPINSMRLLRPCLDNLNFFNQDLDNLIKELKRDYLIYQKYKETTINNAAKLLFEKLVTTSDKDVVYFGVDIRGNYRRIEIVAKILMKIFAKFKGDKKRSVNIVLFGMTEQQMCTFARQFSLFYRNGYCGHMGKSQLFVVSRDYKSQILFFGSSINSSYEYMCSERFTYGISSSIVHIIQHIADKSYTNVVDNILPLNFNALPMLEMTEQSQFRLNEEHHKWYYRNLGTIIEKDLHEDGFGCKIPNTHVRVSNLHLDTFYECQLLFGNPYWCNNFAEYITEKILTRYPLEHYKQKRMVLYGYETYSELLLSTLMESLIVRGYSNVCYIIYENIKYVTTNQKSNDTQIRYFEQFNNTKEDNAEDFCFIFINGISTTLSTFKTMFDKLNSGFQFNVKDCDNSAFVIVQVLDYNKGQLFDDYIEDSEKRQYLKSKKQYLNFVENNECNYLISTAAIWYKPGECPLCNPSKVEEEKILIETNYTSTVPMVLLKPLDQTTTDAIEKQSYIEIEPFSKFFKYGHIQRGNKHYQYYFDSANYVKDNTARNSKLTNWLVGVGGNIDKRIKRDVNHIDKELTKDKYAREARIDVIVCPSHATNTSFVAMVNKYVFQQHAHIISIDTKKEYRETFEAKYLHYRKIIENLSIENRNKVRFHYVDDNIITGSSFGRTKSLVKGLLRGLIPDEKDLYYSIIVLLNQNSQKTKRNYIECTEGFYSFVNLKTPLIRSYGDACPICQKVERLQTLFKESSLSKTAEYWGGKVKKHQVKSIDSKSENAEMRASKKALMRLQCSEVIWSCLKRECYPRINEDNVSVVKLALKESIMAFMNSKNFIKTSVYMEYLISFYKVMSRRYVIFQEYANTAILQILLESYLIIVDENKQTDSFGSFIRNLMSRADSKYIYDFYCTIISCLCDLGSNLFFRNDGEELKRCLKKGLELQKSLSQDDTKHYQKSSELQEDEANNIEPQPFGEILVRQIQKNLHVNNDCKQKVSRMSDILLQQLKIQHTERTSNDLDIEDKFYAKTYFECIDDDSRRDVIAKCFSDKRMSYEKFKSQLLDVDSFEDYKEILKIFKQITESEMIVMFQQYEGRSITDETKYDEIVHLGENDSDANRSIPIIKSELLKFYRDGKSDKDAECRIILNLDDDVKIVYVAEQQSDKTVGSYNRKPCVISFVKIDVNLKNRLFEGKKEKVILYFALFFKEEMKTCLESVLEKTRRFIMFRTDFLARLEKDFDNNLYGIKQEELWRNKWLSIDKAGSHTTSDSLDDVISSSKFLTEWSNIFIEEAPTISNKDKYNVYRMIANAEIARSFRLIFSQKARKSSDGCYVTKEKETKEIYPFRFLQSDKIIIRNSLGEKVTITSTDSVRSAKVYYRESDPYYSGLRQSKPKFFKPNYLYAFLIDVIENALKNGDRISLSTEHCNDDTDYLVIVNNIIGEKIKDNYQLKQSVEFDNAELLDSNGGFSLGCLNSFANGIYPSEDKFLKVSITYNQKCKEYEYTLKLPILKKEE